LLARLLLLTLRRYLFVALHRPAVSPVNCEALACFPQDKVMALSHAALFGGSCWIIELTVSSEVNCIWDARTLHRIQREQRGGFS